MTVCKLGLNLEDWYEPGDITAEEMESFLSILKEERRESGIASGLVMDYPDGRPQGLTFGYLYEYLRLINVRRKRRVKEQERIVGEDLHKTNHPLIFTELALRSSVLGPIENLPTRINHENPYIRAVVKWRIKIGR